MNCGLWIACKIKDLCKGQLWSITFQSQSVKNSPKHLIECVLGRHCLKSSELDFWLPQVLHGIMSL